MNADQVEAALAEVRNQMQHGMQQQQAAHAQQMHELQIEMQRQLQQLQAPQQAPQNQQPRSRTA